jgi:ferrous iron transport protein B
MKIILTGNPNVGKSVVFSKLCGYGAISSNYPGTTVDILIGKVKIANYECEIIDVPGTYSLEGESVAEKVASSIIKKGDYDLIINILDANSLERNLLFALELLSLRKPTIFLINKCDIARNRGVNIDFEKLSKILNVVVIPIIATIGWGFDILENEIKNFFLKNKDYVSDISIPLNTFDKWKMIGEIISKVQKIEHKHPTFLEKLEVLTTTPSIAIPFGIIVIIASFWIVRFIGEGLINNFFDPIFNNYYYPLIDKFRNLISSDLLKSIIFGKNPVAMEGFGIITTGIYVPFVVVLPYVFSFYIVLGFLEDIGYLPRLAVILDRFSHKIGLHGYSGIPLIMGLGCKVPGIFSLRILELSRDKVIAASLMILIAPCIPQTAMIISVLSKYSIIYTFLFFLYLFVVGIITSFILNKILKGGSSDLFIEIPAYHIPVLKNMLFKLKIRIIQFLKDAVPAVIGGIFLINILDILGFLERISLFFAPFFKNIFSLPSEISSIIAIGFLKKDVSITFLVPFNLGLRELMVSSFFLVTYLPCLSSMMVLRKEIGNKNSFYVMCINFVVSLIFTFIFSIFLKFFGV